MKAAVGDSFTYGEELADRSNAWPTVLGYENHGLPGASNEYIFRTAIELAPTCTHMIVAWSECTRHEVYTHQPVTVHRHKQFQGLIQTNSRWTELPWFRELYANYTQEAHQFTRTLYRQNPQNSCSYMTHTPSLRDVLFYRDSRRAAYHKGFALPSMHW